MNQFSNDWLLPLELYELTIEKSFSIQDEVYQHLEELQENSSINKLIKNGLDLLTNKSISTNKSWDYLECLVRKTPQTRLKNI